MLQVKLTEQRWAGRHKTYLSESNQAWVRYTACKNHHMPRKELYEDSILHLSELSPT